LRELTPKISFALDRFAVFFLGAGLCDDIRQPPQGVAGEEIRAGVPPPPDSLDQLR
tara:strand:+ start:1355 stop:1522 length:168 start_codon:yes stop_codon:yes gene_type:complete